MFDLNHHVELLYADGSLMVRIRLFVPQSPQYLFLTSSYEKRYMASMQCRSLGPRA